MISNLKIKNFVLFDDLDINFENGMNSIVGQTGAGKSVIFSAINVLCGQRNIKKFIMKNKDFYELEATIDISKINRNNLNNINQIISTPTSKIHILRKLNSSGKGTIKINDQEVTLSDLKKIMENIVEIHFQNESEEVLKLENQIKFLDKVIDQDLLLNYEEIYEKYVKQKSLVKRLIAEDENKEETLELLGFQINNLKKITTIPSENELESNILELENIDKVKNINEKVTRLLDSVYKELYELQQVVTENEELGYGKYKEVVDNSYYELENLNFEHSKKENKMSVDDLESFKEDLSLLRSLKRKYNLDYDGLLNKYEALKESQEQLNNIGNIIINEEKKLNDIKKEVEIIAQEISKQRKKYASDISNLVNQNFKLLYMEDAKLNISVTTKEIDKDGIDEVEILIRTNKGHDLQNISAIASGGEKSRVMLIFKIVINKFQNKKIFLLDEIDQGVSAQVAKSVGEMIKDFSSGVQVFLISHTPQVINISDHIYEVSKTNETEISTSKIKKLNESEKVKLLENYTTL